jgi:hypothetical protein
MQIARLILLVLVPLFCCGCTLRTQPFACEWSPLPETLADLLETNIEKTAPENPYK